MNKILRKIFILTLFMFLGGSIFSQSIDAIAEDDSFPKYELKATPNPFLNEVTITLTAGNKKVTGIRIHDIIGKEVAFIDLRNKSGILSYKLDFTPLPAGVYFCNVYGEAGIIETKRLSHTK